VVDKRIQVFRSWEEVNRFEPLLKVHTPIYHMITQLNPPIPLETPKGRAFAHLVIDYGIEYDLIWVCFIDETGECWCFRNPEIRIQHNLTFGRKKPGEV
jgi:hypothetical protein